MEAEDWGEKEICSKTVKNKEKAGDGGVNTTLPCPLPSPSTLTPNQTWPVG